MRFWWASLSARRAWIEMYGWISSSDFITVALRKESVDRNQQFRANFQGDPKSLSARRAWIEIKLLRRALQGEQVALRKESVDRNFDICKARAIVARSLSARRAWIEIAGEDGGNSCPARRSPQGERG